MKLATNIHLDQKRLYSVCCGNDGVSSSVGDVDHYVIRKLLYYVFNICTSVFIRRWEIQNVLTQDFRKVPYTRYNVVHTLTAFYYHISQSPPVGDWTVP